MEEENLKKAKETLEAQEGRLKHMKENVLNNRRIDDLSGLSGYVIERKQKYKTNSDNTDNNEMTITTTNQVSLEENKTNNDNIIQEAAVTQNNVRTYYIKEFYLLFTYLAYKYFI